MADPAVYDSRAHYRRFSAKCLALILFPPIACDLLGSPEWLFAILTVVSVVTAIILTVETYSRLRDAGLWGILVLLMYLNIGFGPVFYQSNLNYQTVHFRFALGDLLIFVPIVLGWIMPRRKWAAEPNAEAAARI